MEKFEITLKNDKIKQYDRLALFIIIINFALFLYIAFTTNIRTTRLGAIGGATLISIALGIDYFLRSTKNNSGSPYRIAAEFAISMAWVNMGYWWIAAVCFLLSVLHTAAKRPLQVIVEKGKITYPSLPKKNIDWSELSNIILKDGLLTINFKNDKFIQQFADETKTAVNEQEFNDFCRQQLNK